MNIILSHYPVLVSGGAERSTVDLGAALSKLGHRVYLWGPWSSCQSFVSIAKRSGLQIIPRKATTYPTEIFKLRVACKELDIDVIISSSRRYNIISYFATRNILTQHIPVLRGPISTWDTLRPKTRLLSSTLPVARALWLTILRKMPVIICISKAVAKDVQEVLQCESSKTPVIYNAIGISIGNVINPALTKKKSPFRLILVGRLHPEKRFELIVPLMKEIVRFDKDVLAYIAGEGECKDELSKLIRDSGMDENIRLLGHCDNIMKCYQDAHVLVHFRNDEGFGRIYLEAQMNSLPVVCVTGGAAPEVVCDGVTGYLHDLKDIFGMAQSIIKLKRDKLKYYEMSQRARQWAQENFSLDAMAQQYEMIINKVVKEVINNHK